MKGKAELSTQAVPVASRATVGRQDGDTVPEKRGHRCASCEGRLDGTEAGWVCAPCVWQWQAWHRNEREAQARWVALRMRQTIGEVVRDGR